MKTGIRCADWKMHVSGSARKLTSSFPTSIRSFRRWLDFAIDTTSIAISYLRVLETPFFRRLSAPSAERQFLREAPSSAANEHPAVESGLQPTIGSAFCGCIDALTRNSHEPPACRCLDEFGPCRSRVQPQGPCRTASQRVVLGCAASSFAAVPSVFRGPDPSCLSCPGIPSSAAAPSRSFSPSRQILGRSCSTPRRGRGTIAHRVSPLTA